MDGQARGDLRVAIVERDLSLEHLVHHAGDVVRLEMHAERAMTHAASGAERHLLVLQVIASVRKQRAVAGMVVMHVGKDHVLHRRTIDADRRQTLLYRPRYPLAALVRRGLVEAGVDHERASLAHHGPDEVIERHRHVVAVAPDEVGGRTAFLSPST